MCVWTRSAGTCRVFLFRSWVYHLGTCEVPPYIITFRFFGRGRSFSHLGQSAVRPISSLRAPVLSAVGFWEKSAFPLSSCQSHLFLLMPIRLYAWRALLPRFRGCEVNGRARPGTGRTEIDRVGLRSGRPAPGPHVCERTVWQLMTP